MNEVFSLNVSQCHNTCFKKDFNQTSDCQRGPGCVCINGFVRNQDSYKCVPLKSCADKRGSKECPNNEFYSDCDAVCQKTCQTKNVAVKCRCIAGCACRKGFIRSDVNFQCIPEKLCQSESDSQQKYSRDGIIIIFVIKAVQLVTHFRLQQKVVFWTAVNVT